MKKNIQKKLSITKYYEKRNSPILKLLVTNYKIINKRLTENIINFQKKKNWNPQIGWSWMIDDLKSKLKKNLRLLFEKT